MSIDRSEVVAARGIGVGIGLITLMLVWLVGSRLAEFVWNPPVGPILAFATAIAVGLVTSIVFAHRLAERVDESRHRSAVRRRRAPRDELQTSGDPRRPRLKL